MQCYVTSHREYQRFGGTMTDYHVVTDMQMFKLLCLQHDILNVEIHISSEDMPLHQRRRLTKNNFMLNSKGECLRLVCHAFNIISRRGIVTISCSWFKQYDYTVIEIMPLEDLSSWIDKLVNSMNEAHRKPELIHSMFNMKHFTPIPSVQKSIVELHVQY